MGSLDQQRNPFEDEQWQGYRLLMGKRKGSIWGKDVAAALKMGVTEDTEKKTR